MLCRNLIKNKPNTVLNNSQKVDFYNLFCLFWSFTTTKIVPEQCIFTYVVLNFFGSIERHYAGNPCIIIYCGFNSRTGCIYFKVWKMRVLLGFLRMRVLFELRVLLKRIRIRYTHLPKLRSSTSTSIFKKNRGQFDFDPIFKLHLFDVFDSF